MITITHTHAEGTLIEGSRKGDGVYEILRGLRGNWRYLPSIRKIGLGQSRDKAAKTWDIGQAAEALRKAGHEVTVSIDESERRTVAEVEADRKERAEGRAERYGERAERRSEQAAADYARARQMAEVIPFGQPVMPDHHSYGRDMSYRRRMGRTYDRAFEGMDEAERLAERAAAAEANQSHRESVPATLRRIEKLEAERRSWQRAVDGQPGGHTRSGRPTAPAPSATTRYAGARAPRKWHPSSLLLLRPRPPDPPRTAAPRTRRGAGVLPEKENQDKQRRKDRKWTATASSTTSSSRSSGPA